MRSLIIAVSFMLAGTSFANSYTHELTGIPSEEPTADECRAHASILAEEFASRSPVESAVGLCASVDELSYDVHIRYQSEDRLQIVSTLRGGFTLGQYGFFASQEDCAAVLIAEQTEFESQTGLTSLYTPYCTDMGGFGNDTPWMFRVEATGETEIKPYLGSAAFFGQIMNYSRESFIDAAMDGMTNLGLFPRYARIDSSIGLGYLTVLSYGAARQRFESAEIAKLKTEETCELELARFKQAIEGSNTILTYCGAQHVTGRIEVSGMFLQNRQFETIESVDHFEDYESCSASREDVLSQYRSDGLAAVDGLCSVDQDDRWSVVLLIR